MEKQRCSLGPVRRANSRITTCPAWLSLSGKSGGIIQIGTDQHPATIYIYHQRRGGVSPVLEVRLDKAERLDENGRSYQQEYAITPCASGYARFFSFSPSKNVWHEVTIDQSAVKRRWIKKNNKTTFYPGERKKFIDPDF
jgi:hypothetical protein